SSVFKSTNASSVSETVRKNQVTAALLWLEDKNLRPKELTTTMDYFQFNILYPDAYLMLSDFKVNTNPTTYHVWLTKKLKEATDVPEIKMIMCGT
ncbi:hypothetical protein PAXRUDRAFT_160312, partial [Paxillus rubicundulus Ve08.2h10]